MGDDFVSLIPFASELGLEIAEADPGEVRGSIAWAPEHCTVDGVLHGGVLMSLADTLGAVCAYLNVPEGQTTATIESKTNFLRAVRGGSVHAVSRPLHVGRTFIVVQTELVDEEQRLVAQVTQTQAVLAS